MLVMDAQELPEEETSHGKGLNGWVCSEEQIMRTQRVDRFVELCHGRWIATKFTRGENG